MNINPQQAGGSGPLMSQMPNKEEEQKAAIKLELMKTFWLFIFISFAFEIGLIIAQKALPGTFNAITGQLGNYQVFFHFVIFFYFVYYKGILQNNTLPFTHKIGAFFIATNLYLIAIVALGRQVAGPFYFLADFIGEEYLLTFLGVFTLINILYIKFFMPAVMSFLKIDSIISLIFGDKEEKIKEEKEEVQKPKTREEKMIDWMNSQLQKHGFRSRELPNAPSNSEAIKVITGISNDTVIIQPSSSASFKDLINFGQTVGESTQKYLSSAQEELYNGKRVIVVSLSKPMDLSNDQAVKERADKLKKEPRIRLLEQLKTNPKVSEQFYRKKDTVFFGIDSFNNPLFFGLFDGPHYVVFGETKSGKSVAMHNMIAPLMLKFTPYELQFFIVDPKGGVEFSAFYDGSPFCTMFPPTRGLEGYSVGKETYGILGLLRKEYERRRQILKKYGVRNLESLPDQRATLKKETMPYVIVVIDEYLELKSDGKLGASVDYELEKFISIARFTGIHIIMATQKPTSDVISGKLKLNAPVKIGLKVDKSRTSTEIIGDGVAAKLQGLGDAVFNFAGTNKRFQSMFLSDGQIRELVEDGAKKFPEFKRPTDDEYKQMIREGFKYWEGSNSVGEDMNEETQESTGTSLTDMVQQEDFETISPEVKEAVASIPKEIIGDNSPLHLKEAQKMITYMFSTGQLDSGVFKTFVTISRKEYNTFRNLLLHSQVVYSDDGETIDVGQPLKPNTSDIVEFVGTIALHINSKIQKKSS